MGINHINKVIRQKGMSLNDVAAQMTRVVTDENGNKVEIKGISQSALTQIINSKKGISYKRLQEIAGILNCSVTELVEDGGQKINALVKYRDEFYEAKDVDELQRIVDRIRYSEENRN